MTDFPDPGGDKDVWATKLKAWNFTEHNTDGSHGGDPTRKDSDDNNMVKSHAYLTRTAGFVTVWTGSGTTNAVTGWVGDTDNPVGAGLQIAEMRGGGGGSLPHPFISFFVAKGKYFEVKQSGVTMIINWTPFVAGGGAPIDQD